MAPVTLRASNKETRSQKGAAELEGFVEREYGVALHEGRTERTRAGTRSTWKSQAQLEVCEFAARVRQFLAEHGLASRTVMDTLSGTVTVEITGESSRWGPLKWWGLATLALGVVGVLLL